MSSRQQLQKFVVGNAATLAAAGPISIEIGAEGYSQLSLEFDLTRVAGSQLDVTYFIKQDDADANWHRLTAVSGSALGVQTRSPLSDRWTVSGHIYDSINMPLNYRLLKVVFTLTGGTTDTLKVSYALGAS